MVIPPELFADGLSQFWGSSGGGIFGKAFFYGPYGGLLDVRRGVKVWLTHAKAQHLYPLLGHLLHPGTNLYSARVLEFFNQPGQHLSPLLSKDIHGVYQILKRLSIPFGLNS